jgi:hypothetical protein
VIGAKSYPAGVLAVAHIWGHSTEGLVGGTEHYFNSRIELAGGVLNFVKASRDQLEHALFLDD